MDLVTKYLGLTLAHLFMVGASPLSDSATERQKLLAELLPHRRSEAKTSGSNVFVPIV
jgi:hypothetical protein